MTSTTTTRSLIKSQIQQRQRQHEAFVRGFSDYLHKHQRVLIELAMDELPSSQQNQQQHQQRLSGLGTAAALEAAAADAQQQAGMVVDSAPEAGSSADASSSASAAAEGEAGSSGVEVKEGVASVKEEQPPSELGLARVGSLPSLLVSSREIDRLGFLLQPVPGAGGRAAGGAAMCAADGGPAAAGGSGVLDGSGAPSSLSTCLPQFATGLSAVMYEDVYAWLSASLRTAAVVPTTTPVGSGGHAAQTAFSAGGGGEQQLPVLALLNGSNSSGGTGQGSGGGAAAAGALSPAVAVLSDMGAVAGLFPALGAAPLGGAPMDTSGCAPQQQQQQLGTSAAGPLSPVVVAGAAPQSPSASPLLGPNGLGSQPLLSPLSLGPSTHMMRINTHPVSIRGVVGASTGQVDDRRVRGVYRGTVVRGESDVGPSGELLIQDCVDCHIYVLAPLRWVLCMNCWVYGFGGVLGAFGGPWWSQSCMCAMVGCCRGVHVLHFATWWLGHGGTRVPCCRNCEHSVGMSPTRHLSSSSSS